MWASLEAALLLPVVAFVSLLPAIYAICVHIFLVAFRERPTLFGRRWWRHHWSPIVLRLGYASVVIAGSIVYYGGSSSRGEEGHDNDDAFSSFWLGLGGGERGRGQCIDGIIPVAASSSSGSSSTTTTCLEQEAPTEISAPQLLRIRIGILRSLLLLTISIAVSIQLLLRTRRIEVDGPIPPCCSIHYCDLGGKTIFVTGANAGIGFETAKQLYGLGANVVLGCRSKKRAVEAMRRIIGTDYTDDDDDYDSHCSNHTKIITAQKRGLMQNNGKRKNTGRLYFVPLDLTSRASIHRAAHAFQHTMDLPLHVLINNAGVMRSRREVTEDGFEMTMAANHLGHFLLTGLLLPKLRDTAMKEGRSSRVITISSSLHRNATRPCASSPPSSSSPSHVAGWRDGVRRMKRWNRITSEPGIDLDDLHCERKKYTLFGQYAQTKLANVMFAFELNRRESKFRLLPLDDGRRRRRRLNDPSDDVGCMDDKEVEKSCFGGPQRDNVDDESSDSGKVNDKNIPATESLESYYPQVVSYCVHPGLVRTDFVRDMPWYLYYPNKLCYLVMITLQKTPRSGAYTTVFCSTMDTRMKSNNRNDCYFVNSELQPVANCALNKNDAARLWELSSDLVLNRRNE